MIKNKELIAISQDSLGKPGVLVCMKLKAHKLIQLFTNTDC
jgi:hypothetical protein